MAARSWMDLSFLIRALAPRPASTTCSIPSTISSNWSNTPRRPLKRRRRSRSIGRNAGQWRRKMRSIAIVGSGQAGLLAAHALTDAGYGVMLYSDRTAEQWLNESRPTGTAARFQKSLEFERELGL